MSGILDENAATITATSTIRKAKSAYLYYQSEMLSKIRNEMGGSSTVSMGDAMTEVRFVAVYYFCRGFQCAMFRGTFPVLGFAVNLLLLCSRRCRTVGGT